jgi:methyl-accepting chemotaxis protein
MMEVAGNILGRISSIRLHSISTRLYLAFATVTALAVVAAIIAWTAFGTTKATLDHLTRQDLPLMNGAIDLERQVYAFATDLDRLGQLENEAERNKAYLALMKGSSEIDDSMYSVSELVKGDKGALARMMDLGATLTSAITSVNKEVTARIAASVKRRALAGQIAAIDDTLKKSTDDGAASAEFGALMADIGYVRDSLNTAAYANSDEDQAPVRQRFDEAAAHLLRRVDAVAPKLGAPVRALIALGQGDASVFADWDAEHHAAQAAQQAVAGSGATVGELRRLLKEYVGTTRNGVAVAANHANEEAERGRWLILATTAAGALVSLLIGILYVGNSLIRRLHAVVDATKTVASGNLNVDVPSGARDEIGEMANALQVFKKNGLEMERMRAEQAATEKRNQEQRRATMVGLADRCDASVMTIVEHVSGAAMEMQETAGNLSRLAQEASDQSGKAASGAESTSVNVQAMAAAVRELTQSIREISQRVNESAEIASSAVEQARKTNETVDGMKRAAQHVGEIVGLINDIASQTNLLALNATIEAARAGEAGKGFAVVASEVKQLANQTSNATDDIRRQIESMQRITSDAVGAIDLISSTIQRINEISSTVASAVVEQGAAIEDMARNAQAAADATGNVSLNIGGVNAASDRTGEAAGQVLSASSELAESAERLKREVSDFLSTVRAA